MKVAGHILARAEGGTHELSNMQAECDFHERIKTAEDRARGTRRAHGKE